METMVTSVRHAASVNFWQGKRVLLTGHTGFKGGWLALWLQRLGAVVTGIALPPQTRPNLFELARVADGMHSHFADIRDAAKLMEIVQAAQPEVVFHLAAQPLVRASYREPVATFASNVMGTVHVLDSMRGLDSVRVAVMVTTDKVYRNLEHPYPYREDDVLGGHDPYSASKAASEIVIASYRDAFLAQQGVAIASARAGNVIGGGDWSEDRLIPDALRAWQSGQLLEVRRPEAIRPWQHVLEPLSGYLVLAEMLWHEPARAGAYNFGPFTHEAATVRKVIEMAREAYGQGDVRYGYGAGCPHEAGWLALETSKTRVALGVVPCWSLAESVSRTIAWHRAQHGGADARGLCEAEIKAHETRV
ncbi:CDP-glucose 4,6-dehydratase [Azotobacter vinelandii DJ]|nr:CDP-glucose 4,6-dehydratase [Azotobacter vinelandii]WKN19934.1 CDP-glucose 4,6-dehydratase [Azotobacter vinelandii]GLK59733.1 CDP-glucose 4,6-dehydratase [Azotobacter vinelandii]SFY12285.1 CDP-glucose 4,6-dehydratase [Azotobacter vinelandii]